jgi:hypothetical protein
MKLNRTAPIKPYKPVMVATIIVLVHKGKLRSPYVYLDGALRSVFFQLFDEMFPDWPISTRPKPYDPFRALASEGFWTLVGKPEQKEALERSITNGVWNVLGQLQCAKLDAEIFHALASDPGFRLRTLEVLAKAYANVLPQCALRTFVANLGPDRRTYELQPDVSERAIEEALDTHWKRGTFFKRHGVRLADVDADRIRHRQVITPNSTIDLLGFQEKEGVWWVFELKYGDASRNAVAQALGYAHWVRVEHAKRKHEVKGVVLTDSTSRAMLGAAEEGHVEVWTYEPEHVLRGHPEFEKVA